MLWEITQAIADTRRPDDDTEPSLISNLPLVSDRAIAAAVVAVVEGYDYLPDPFIMAIPDDILDLLSVRQVVTLGFAMAGAVVGLIGGDDV